MKNCINVYLLVVCLAFMFDKAYSQNYTINLIDKYGTSLVPSVTKITTRVTDIEEYRNLDTTRYPLWAVRYLTFNPIQTIVEKAIKNKVKKERIRKFLIENNIDTSSVNYEILKGNTLSVFVGLDTLGNKTVIIDVNHNNDFNDDKKYVFDLSKKDDYPIITYVLNYYDGKKINRLERKLTLDAYAEAYQKYDVKGKPIPRTYEDNALNATFFDNSYKSGFLILDGNKYWLNLRGDLLNTVKKDKWILAIKKDKDSLTKRVYTYYPADTIYINRKIFKLANVIDHKLYIKKIGVLTHDNGAVNTLAPPVEGEEINTGEFITLEKKQGKFTIIDFWGSWCIPCINALPDLVELKDKYVGKNLAILSIAFDDQKDLEKVKSLVIDKKLKWEHLLESKNGNKKIVNDYLIQAYPTTLLINPDGKVVVRGIGASVFNEIDIYLSKHLK